MMPRVKRRTALACLAGTILAPAARAADHGFGAVHGGPANFGTLFAAEPTGDVTLMHQFDYTDGSLPFAGLLAASNGRLYGTTSFAGGIFRLKP